MTMKVPLLDLKSEYEEIREEVMAGWAEVFGTMKLLKGENLKAFEEEIADYIGTAYAIGVASGTDALVLALKACDISIGDEVILQANAFAADIEAIKMVGATPVLVDIGTDFGPYVGEVERRVTSKTRAILVVHMYGIPIDLTPILNIISIDGVDIDLIEDCSHAHGAEYCGSKVGSLGTVGCFSCGPVKNLGAYGDAGFITTNNGVLNERIRALQAHGQKKKNVHSVYGMNSRLDELQAVVLRAKLKRLDRRNSLRNENADYYARVFSDYQLPVEPMPWFDDRTIAYHQYVIRVDSANRDELIMYLKEHGIGTGVHYPVPLHKQPSFPYPKDYHLPVSEKLANQIISIPVYPGLTTEQLEYVIQTIAYFFGG